MSPAFTFVAVLVPRAHYIQRAKICNMQITQGWPVAPCTCPAAQSSDGHLTAQRLLMFVVSGLKPKAPPPTEETRDELSNWPGLTIFRLFGGEHSQNREHRCLEVESQLRDSETPVEKLDQIFKQVLYVTTTFNYIRPHIKT